MRHKPDHVIVKWSLLTVLFAILICVMPPLGLLLGAVVGWYGVREARSRAAAAKIRREQEALRQWRANPWNQQFMQGNGSNGGLSIEERNAYRRSVNRER